MFLRTAAVLAALAAAALMASTASAAVTGTLTCIDVQTVLLTVTGLTPDGTVTVQKIVKGVPGDPEQYTADATGTLTQVINVGIGAFPIAVHATDDLTGFNTTTDAISCGGKRDCMQGGYAGLGFRNQGQCIAFFEPAKKT